MPAAILAFAVSIGAYCALFILAETILFPEAGNDSAYSGRITSPSVVYEAPVNCKLNTSFTPSPEND
ncbi:MAG TPA: hypothetical protein PKC38_06700, partial [Chitinophagales bacterium]|nr:hypothetical protein [Chitinophagales bacterium]